MALVSEISPMFLSVKVVLLCTTDDSKFILCCAQFRILSISLVFILNDCLLLWNPFKLFSSCFQLFFFLLQILMWSTNIKWSYWFNSFILNMLSWYRVIGAGNEVPTSFWLICWMPFTYSYELFFSYSIFSLTHLINYDSGSSIRAIDIYDCAVSIHSIICVSHENWWFWYWCLLNYLKVCNWLLFYAIVIVGVITRYNICIEQVHNTFKKRIKYFCHREISE